jgi:hypothetical protein
MQIQNQDPVGANVIENRSNEEDELTLLAAGAGEPLAPHKDSLVSEKWLKDQQCK